jgi:hypothetical protein
LEKVKLLTLPGLLLLDFSCIAPALLGILDAQMSATMLIVVGQRRLSQRLNRIRRPFRRALITAFSISAL